MANKFDIVAPEEMAPAIPAADATDLETQRKIELLKRVKQMRGNVHEAMSGNIIEGSPAKFYCWVYNHPDRVATYEGMNYEVVKKAHKVKTKWEKEDGTHRHGDRILMQCDKEWAEALEASNAAEALEADRRNPAGFTVELQQWAARNRVPIGISGQTD